MVFYYWQVFPRSFQIDPYGILVSSQLLTAQWCRTFSTSALTCRRIGPNKSRRRFQFLADRNDFVFLSALLDFAILHPDYISVCRLIAQFVGASDIGSVLSWPRDSIYHGLPLVLYISLFLWTKIKTISFISFAPMPSVCKQLSILLLGRCLV